MTTHCKGKKANGEPCVARPGASGFCFTHDPERKRDADRARKLGGKHRRRVLNNTRFPEVNVQSAQGLAAFVESVMRETWRLEAGVARSRTLGYLAGVMRTLIETSALEARVERLEKLLADRPD